MYGFLLGGVYVLYSWCAAAIVTEVLLQLLWNKLFLSKCIVMQCKCSYSISKPKMFSFNKDKCENTRKIEIYREKKIPPANHNGNEKTVGEK